MGQLSLFQMPFSEFGLKDAVSEALLQEVNNTSVNQFSIENSLEAAIKSHIQSGLKNASFNGQCPTCPPNNGLRTKFILTLQIQINYRVSFKAGLHAGLEFGNSWSSINSSAHLSFYNSGLGTPIYDNNKEKRKLVVDTTVALNVTIGNERGKGNPMKQYLINYDTPMPVENTYSDWSVGYGQAFTWNSAINNHKFDLKDVQRQGIWNVRVGNFALSTNNDTDRKPYFGGGTDYGYTGGLILSFDVARLGIIEAVHQTFTGKYRDKATVEERREELANQIENIEKDKTLSKDEKERIIKVLKEELKEFLKKNPLHTQDDTQKKYNKAVNLFGIRRDGNSIRLEVETGGYAQDHIHQGDDLKIGNWKIFEPVLDLKFDFEKIRSINNKPKIWIEKAFQY
ncbi:polymorphic toxin type 23 domain-containing protein [Capnocytophaga canis]|uniref:polymorphic toxin type 23 domain-containing protein n=1 Tax=Capnocytophaga canis TaxID=1848903 RepID=UPI00370D18CF